MGGASPEARRRQPALREPAEELLAPQAAASAGMTPTPLHPRRRGFPPPHHPHVSCDLKGLVMSPYLFSGDHAATDLGRKARAATTVAEATVLSITDLFGEYATARAAGDLARMRQLRRGADPQLLAELDGFGYPAAA